jgi:hypothetical protein
VAGHRDVAISPARLPRNAPCFSAWAAPIGRPGPLPPWRSTTGLASDGESQMKRVGFWFFKRPVGRNPNWTFSGAHQVGTFWS